MIHPTAVVEDGARLGSDVQVGPHAYVASRVSIGDGCHIGPHACILPYATLGAGCRVHACAVIGDVPQDLGFEASSESFVRIGAGCVFREGVTVHRGTKPGTVTEIGDGCFLMANAHVAHNVKIGNRVILANGVLLGGYVEIGDGAFISGNCLVHQFTRVGRLAMMGGGSGVSKDVPPFVTMRPISSNTVLGLNVVGMRRAGIGPEDRARIKKVFQTLYRSGLNTDQAMEQLRASNPEGPALEMIRFVETSKRGICGGGAASADE